MKQIVLTSVITLAFSATLFAQGKTGVNTTTPTATLEIKGDGTSKTVSVTKNGGGEAVTILNNGNLGLNNPAPTTKLDIIAPSAGTGLKLADGSQGAGKVLVSDANGNASWQNNNTGFGSDFIAAAGGFSCPFNGAAQTPVTTNTTLTVPSSGWYVVESGLTIITNDWNDYTLFLYIGGINRPIWQVYAGDQNDGSLHHMIPRDQSKLLYLPQGVHTIYGYKSQTTSPSNSCNAGNPSFYVRIAKLQN